MAFLFSPLSSFAMGEEPTDFYLAQELPFIKNGNEAHASEQNYINDGGIHYYYFQVDDYQKINIQFEATSSATIEIYDEDRNELFSFNIGYTKNLNKTIGLKKGKYFLSVDASTWDNISYQLDLTAMKQGTFEQEPNDTITQANPISLNKKYYGYGRWEYDIYQFELLENQVIGIRLTTPYSASKSVSILDFSGREVTSKYLDDDIWQLQLPAGQYYLKVSSVYEENYYDIEIATRKFKDVPIDFWAVKEINYLSDLTIIKGYAHSMFKPNDSVKRAQAAVMLVRSLGLNTENHPDPKFKDVPKTYWAYKEIATLVDEGIYPKGEYFYPEQPLKRDDMARMLVNAYRLQGQYNGSFKDVPKTHWAYSYIQRLAANGVTTGYSDGTYKPNLSVTRAQFSVFMCRAIDSDYIPSTY